MMAWSRCCASAWIVSKGEPVSMAWSRQQVNIASCPVLALRLRSLTRRTISRAVMAWPFLEVNAVYCASATLAWEIQQSSWSSQIAGVSDGCPGCPGDAGDCCLHRGIQGRGTEMHAPARRTEAVNAAH